MRRLLVIGLVLAGISPAFAAHRVSVSQLRQTLAADLAKHRSDADIARQLGNFQLSERLTPKTLDHLLTNLDQHPQTALAVALLADESSLLDPPRAELPAAAPPDQATQLRILQAASNYIARTIDRLPNFFATRTTIRFDDGAHVVRPGEWPIRAGFHPVGTRSRIVTFRDGSEVTDAAPVSSAARAEPQLGLYSFGEFGPILARTLADLAKGKVAFSHWEDSPLGIVAVFRYAVPRHDSHYQVHFCCILNSEYEGAASYRDRNLPRYHSNNPNPVETTGMVAYDATPAYHGTLAIDPATGAIARMTLDAELDPDNPITRASTVVEYSRVVIGDQPFVCPIRSLALSAQHGPPPASSEPDRAPILSINETTFTQYHRLGSSARLIADGSVPPGIPGQQPGAAAVPAAPVVPPATDSPDSPDTPAPSEPPAAAAQPVMARAAAPPVAHDSPAPAPSASSTSSAAGVSAPADPPPPEISVLPAASLPDTPPTSPPAETGASRRAPAQLVSVRVIAFDRKGRPVTDLTAQNFELYDNGRKQELTSFSAPPSSAIAAQPAQGSTLADSPAFSNRPGSSSPAAAAAAGTIFLLDESHLTWADLNYARRQMLKFLSALPATQPVALYAMDGLGFRILQELTPDHRAVASQLSAFLPTAQSASEAQERERRTLQQIATEQSTAGNSASADSPPTIAPELVREASSPDHSALIVLAQVARHLALFPGAKTLFWLSCDGVLAGSRDKAARNGDPAAAVPFAIRAQEAMNQAHAAVFPLDVSTRDAGAPDPQSTMDLQEAAAESAAAAASAGSAGGSGSLGRGNRDSGIGRLSTQTTPDSHAIQPLFRDLAAGTGGQVIGRTSNLVPTLATIAAQGAATYELSFAPQGSADNRYHTLVVKVSGRKAVSLRYRAGYVFAAEPSNLKDRFRNALWQPADTSGIGLTASIRASSTQPALHIKIAGSDLALRQQDGRWLDKLDIFLAERDDAGTRAKLDAQTLGLRLLPATYQTVLGNGIPFEHAVHIEPGIASLRVLVVDENSGQIGTVTIPAAALKGAQ